MIYRAAIAALMLASANVASAQQWKLEAQGGRIRSALDPSSRPSESVAAGVGYEDLSTAFRISTGIPTQSDAPYWGAVGLWKRAAITKNGFTAGVDLSGNGYAFQDRVATGGSGGGLFEPVTPGSKRTGRVLAGQALPLVGFEMGTVQLQARAGISHYNSSIGSNSRDRTVKLGDLQMTFQPTPNLALIPVVRRFQASGEKAATFAGLSGLVAQGRVSAWANAGQWLDGADTASNSKTAWGAGGAVRLAERLGSTRRRVMMGTTRYT